MNLTGSQYMYAAATQKCVKWIAVSILLVPALAYPVSAQTGDCSPGSGCMEFDLEAGSGNTGRSGDTGNGGSGGRGGTSGAANGGDALSNGGSASAAAGPEALIDQSNDGGSIDDVKGGAAGQSSLVSSSGAEAGQAAGGGDSTGGDATSGAGGEGGSGNKSGTSGDTGASGDTCTREVEGGAPLCAQSSETS